jgi:hypothetical protein
MQVCGIGGSWLVRPAGQQKRLNEETVKTIYEKIEEEARPYLDTRSNEIHTSVCYAMAKQLLTHHPEADEGVVLPAILLHDVGWKMVPEEKHLGAFGPRAKDMETRRIHEIEGARIARRILASLQYNEKKTEEIVGIIEGHDSREKALSLNDAVVKDADKLWRFSPVGMEVDYQRFAVDRNRYVAWLTKGADMWFFTPAGRELASQGLAEAGITNDAGSATETDWSDDGFVEP